MTRVVAIVGGGLAGIAAALRVAEAGWNPVVIESSKRLGGRATSFDDPRTGMTLDNCQHVVMGCCTNLLDLYERLGVPGAIEWHRTFFWTRGDGVIDEMRASRLPAPLHFGPAMSRFRIFDAAQKKEIRRAMWRLLRLGGPGRITWRGKSFRAFLESCGQSDAVIADFWNTIIVSACNLDVARVDAPLAMKVMQEGFLDHPWSSAMGLATIPLGDLYAPLVAAVEDAGGEVRLGTSARGLLYDGSRITGVVTADGLVAASEVVCAVPFDRLARLATETLRTRDRRFAALDEMETSPILGVHLFFDQEVMTLPHLVCVGRGVQWLFNKGWTDGANGRRQHVHAVISGADAWMDLDETEIARRVRDDLWHVLPAARGIEPVAVRAIKEKRATFAGTPAFESIRPGGEPGMIGVGGGDVPNLHLAGDWVDTGWPATMESAVRSGYSAAAAITGRAPALVEDVPKGWLARVLSRNV